MSAQDVAALADYIGFLTPVLVVADGWAHMGVSKMCANNVVLTTLMGPIM